MTVYLLTFLLGASVASFLNVVAKSVPKNNNWWSRRSACPNCQAILRARHLIPVISYLWQSGQCQTCQTKIPISYLVVEVFGGLLVLTPLLFPTPNLLQAWLFLAMLLTVTLTDLYYRIIPNKILITFAIPLFLLQPQLAGALTGFLFFYGTALLGKFLFQKATIGGGDIKLYLVIGLVLPPQPLILSVVMASGIALFYVLVISKNKKQEIPFAPFIALGSLFAYFSMFW